MILTDPKWRARRSMRLALRCARRQQSAEASFYLGSASGVLSTQTHRDIAHDIARYLVVSKAVMGLRS